MGGTEEQRQVYLVPQGLCHPLLFLSSFLIPPQPEAGPHTAPSFFFPPSIRATQRTQVSFPNPPLPLNNQARNREEKGYI